jgi:hypothetical protein
MKNRVLFLALAALLVVAGCSKNTSGQTTTSAPNAAATAAPTNAMSMTTPNGTSVALMASLPMYPGASTEVKGNSGGVGTGTSSGQILRTSDPFSKVYAWYQTKMPAHSEKSHMTMAGVETALFVLGSGNKHQTVTITRTAADPDTLITLAQVSQ